MYPLSNSSLTLVPAQTLSSSSRLVTKRWAFCTRYSKTSNVLGRRFSRLESRQSCSFATSSRNGGNTRIARDATVSPTAFVGQSSFYLQRKFHGTSTLLPWPETNFGPIVVTC